MFCKYCGNRLEDGDRFCGACGHPVKENTMQEEASEKTQKKPEYEAPKIRKRNPEPEYDNRMTAGMGYGYRIEKNSDPDDDDDAYDEEWEKEEKKERITFAVLGVVIVILVVAIVFGVVKLVGSGSGDGKKVPQLNEQMKEELQKSQQKEENDTADAAESSSKEPETVTPEVAVTPETSQEAVQDTAPVQETQPAPTQQATPEPTQQPVQQKEAAASANSGADADESQNAENTDYVIPDSSTRYLSNADLTGLSEWQIRIARNEIYARHGRIFKSDDLIDYFTSKSWYTPSVPPEQFDNSYLNAIEIENVKLITAYEKAHNLNQ